MSERSDRPFTEIRLPEEKYTDEVHDWISDTAKFLHQSNSEFILLLPHPKHKAMGGMDIGEFLKDCPDELSVEIRAVYESRLKDRESNSWQTGYDLDNDFGFLLIAVV